MVSEAETFALGGVSYSIYRRDRTSLAKAIREARAYEPELLRFFAAVTRPGQVAVDIGANFGYFTVPLSRMVGPEGRVIAFEPDPRNRAILEQNVTSNDCRNVTVIGKAVSDEVGRATLYLDRALYGVHSLSGANVINAGGTVEVETTMLDHEMALLGLTADVLKIDSQGSESRIVSQAGRALSPQAWAALEYWPHGLRSMGSEPVELLRLLRGMGFSIGLPRTPVEEVTDRELLGRSLKGHSSINIVAWR